MKTRIIERQINFGSKKFVPQFKGWFLLFYIIPIPVWKDFDYEFGDAGILGLPMSSHEFFTKEEAEKFLKNI